MEALDRINSSKEKQAASLTSKLKNSKSLSGFKTHEIKDFFGMYKAQILDILPKAIPVDKFLQMAVNLVNSNPELQKCTPQSIIGFILNSAQLGLNIVPQLAECYAVPYNTNVGGKNNPIWEKQVQFQLGYKGLVKLVRNSGEIKNVWAEVVYPGDYFDYDLGLNPKLEHKRNDDLDQNPTDITHAYAIAEYRDGTKSFLVLNKKQIERLRMASPSAKDKDKLSPSWGAWYDEMAKIKAIKRLAKQLPLDTIKQEALISDEQVINAEDISNNGYNTFKASFDTVVETEEDDTEYTVFEEVKAELEEDKNETPTKTTTSKSITSKFDL